MVGLYLALKLGEHSLTHMWRICDMGKFVGFLCLVVFVFAGVLWFCRWFLNRDETTSVVEEQSVPVGEFQIPGVPSAEGSFVEGFSADELDDVTVV